MSSDIATELAAQTAAREAAEQRLADLIERVDGAQQLANMGDYDWHIAMDTNRWSDQLYRIYGHEPGSFEATYDVFLAHIHPDDRERVTRRPRARLRHRRAVRDGRAHRAARRQVRFLSSNGQVIMGPTGTPERMRGTCIDITDRVEAEQARSVAAAALSEPRCVGARRWRSTTTSFRA